jgi:hypothetical protein
METPSAGVTVTVTPAATVSLFTPADTPFAVLTVDASAVELGVKIQVNTAGSASGIRFYKDPYNAGPHVGNLWSSTGALLASANFTGETASGWQQANFSAPVPLTANATYVASYHTASGFYSADLNYFFGPRTVDPLLAPGGGNNGVFAYGSASVFPASTFLNSNYWVDLVFNGAGAAKGGAVSLFSTATTPTNVTVNDANPVELGVKFETSVAGQILGILFYKGPQNTGTHVVNLWNSTGTLLASATSSGETLSGWQTVNFASPVTLTANTIYVASYHTGGFYSADSDYFATDKNSGSLTAPSSISSGGNGVYAYGGGSSFPTSTFNATNYWVDVLFLAATVS